VIDKMCRELGLDPFEVRRKNLLTPTSSPTPRRSGLVYDTGNYQATLDKAMAMADVAGFAKRAAESKRAASCAAWGCRPGSRLAGLRRRIWWASLAAASGFMTRRRCG
jgi:carbon-monoxide dehydrogenase large subunit